MDDKHDEIRDWLGRIDPMGALGSHEGKPRKVKHVLPLVRLAVVQTIALALILAAAVVGIMALVMRNQPKQQPPTTNMTTNPSPAANVVPPPRGSVPAFSIGSSAIPAPDAGAGELDEKIVAWRIDSGAEHAFGPVAFSNQYFAFAGDNGNIYGVRIDGERLWSYRFPEDGLRGLLRAARGVLAYSGRKAIVLDAKGNVKHNVDFKTYTRGRVNFDHEKQQLITYSYEVTGRDGKNTAEQKVSIYNITDGSLAWEWAAPDEIYWAVPGDDAVYVLVRSGEQASYGGTKFPTTEVYKVTPSGVSWHKDFGVHYGDSEPVLAGSTLYVGGSKDKQPALLAVNPADGSIQRSVELERWAIGPLQYDQMHGTVYIPGSNIVQVVMADQLLYKAGTDVHHANAFDVDGGNMVVLRDYDMLVYNHIGRPSPKIPLGKELGNRPKGSVLHHQSGILATFGGELVNFDFMSSSLGGSRNVGRL